MLTRSSVVWADRIVATSSSNAFVWSRAHSWVAVPGYSRARRSATTRARPFGERGRPATSPEAICRRPSPRRPARARRRQALRCGRDGPRSNRHATVRHAATAGWYTGAMRRRVLAIAVGIALVVPLLLLLRDGDRALPPSASTGVERGPGADQAADADGTADRTAETAAPATTGPPASFTLVATGDVLLHSPLWRQAEA